MGGPLSSYTAVLVSRKFMPHRKHVATLDLGAGILRSFKQVFYEEKSSLLHIVEDFS